MRCQCLDLVEGPSLSESDQLVVDPGETTGRAAVYEADPSLPLASERVPVEELPFRGRAENLG